MLKKKTKIHKKTSENPKALKSIIPVQKLLPNILTIFSLCLGLTSIRYSIDNNYQASIALIIIAAFMDGIDGRLARALGSATGFGAQLDSLADLVSFGVAPSILLYKYSLHKLPLNIGWGAVLFYSVCGLLRLARFHIQEADSNLKFVTKQCFIGIPITASACFTTLPIMLKFKALSGTEISFSPTFFMIYIIILGIYMISNLPTFSTKNITISKRYAAFTMVFITALIMSLIIAPWVILPIIAVIYLILNVYSTIKYFNIFNK